MKKLRFIATLVAVCGALCFTATPAFAAESDSTPWFIGEESFQGAEDTNPENFQEGTFGTEFEHIGNAVSGVGSVSDMKHLSTIKWFSLLLNPFTVVFGLGILVSIINVMKNRNDKKAENARLALEERRIALEERKFEAGDKTPDSKPVSGTQPQRKRSPQGEPAVAGLSAGIVASNAPVAGDINGDGVVDSRDYGAAGLDIPFFNN